MGFKKKVSNFHERFRSSIINQNFINKNNPKRWLDRYLSNKRSEIFLFRTA